MNQAGELSISKIELDTWQVNVGAQNVFRACDFEAYHVNLWCHPS